MEHGSSPTNYPGRTSRRPFSARLPLLFPGDLVGCPTRRVGRTPRYSITLWWILGVVPLMFATGAGIRRCSATTSCVAAYEVRAMTGNEGSTMTIPPDLEAQILRYHHVEKWRAGTIARQLS